MKVRKSVRLPVHARDWRLMAGTIRRVLSKPPYAALSGAVAVLSLSAIVIAQNGELFVRIVLLSQLPLDNRLHVLLAMYPFLGTSFELLTGALFLVVATLIGIDIALLTYHFREHGISLRSAAGGTAGTAVALVGALGAGCIVCGTSVLAGLLSVVGITGGILVLPLEGVEFTLLAIISVIISIFWITEGMHGGICKGKISD